MARKVSKIQTSTITQQVVDLLKERILNGELVSGQRIWAADLADEFGVSLIPVKDALLILQGEGLIINVPRRGSIVRQFTLRDVMELLHVRQIIEIDAANLIIDNPAVIDNMLAELSQHNEIISKERNEQGGWRKRSVSFESDHGFHNALVGSCGNNLLIEWYTRLNTQAQIIRLSFWNIGPRGDKTFYEHDAIIQAIKKRDLPATHQAIKSHLDSIKVDYQKAVEEGLVTIGLIEEGPAELPHGRRQLKSKPK
jgi:DNA-binding GntR family transcriptional regulator